MEQSNLCYTVLLGRAAGENIGIIKHGERGYIATWLNWGAGDKAAELVREANARRGIDAAMQLDYEIKSMFIWPRVIDHDDDSPREPMQFIPHAGDYSIFD